MKSVYLPFILCNEMDQSTYDGILGSLHNHYEEYDIITQLYNSNIISHRLFSQYIISDTKGVMTIGDYPEILKGEVIKKGNEDFVDYCNIPIEEKGWVCESDQIIIKDNYGNEKKYKQSLKIKFDTGSSNNISSQLYDLIVNNYFSNYINEGICKLITQQLLTVLICNKSIFSKNEIETIKIYFGRKYFSINKNELFTFSPSLGQYMMTFIRRKSLYTSNSDLSNIIGMSSLRNYITIFNKDDYKFGFVRVDSIGEEKEINKNNSNERIKNGNEEDIFNKENGFFKKEFLERIISSNEDRILNHYINTYIQQLDKYFVYSDHPSVESSIKKTLLEMNNKILERINKKL